MRAKLFVRVEGFTKMERGGGGRGEEVSNLIHHQ